MNSKFLIILLVIIFLVSGCVTLYKPNAVYSPLLKEKREFNLSGSLGLSGCGILNLQSSYAVSNHIGIMVDGMYHFRRDTYSDTTIERLNIYSGEAGLGYFTKTGSEKSNLFQFYGGIGYGKTNDKILNSHQQSPEISSKYYNFFLQPGYAYIFKKTELAFDLRANYVRLYDVHSYLYDNFHWWNTNFKYYYDRSLDFIILEPTVTLKFGNENVKGIVQSGITLPIVNSQSYFDVNNSSYFIVPLFKFSIGLSYTFK